MKIFLFAAAVVSSGAGAQETAPLRDKTLVSWVRIGDLDSRGGSVLTIQSEDEEFDAVVFGELAPRKWMAGSDMFRRTQRDQAAWPSESAARDQVVQIAAVYRDREIAIYRDGSELCRHRVDRAQEFGAGALVVFGLRHLAAGDRAGFNGAILDARIFAEALEGPVLKTLKPDEAIGPKPWAWWTFESGKVEDLTKRFPVGHLYGNARVEKGELVLPGSGAHAVVGGEPPRTRESEDWPVWHVSAWPDEGVALPYDANGCIFWKGRYHLMYIYQVVPARRIWLASRSAEVRQCAVRAGAGRDAEAARVPGQAAPRGLRQRPPVRHAADLSGEPRSPGSEGLLEGRRGPAPARRGVGPRAREVHRRAEALSALTALVPSP